MLTSCIANIITDLNTEKCCSTVVVGLQADSDKVVTFTHSKALIACKLHASFQIVFCYLRNCIGRVTTLYTTLLLFGVTFLIDFPLDSIVFLLAA